MLVVSNDRDLLQLLEANVSVLQIPAPVGESSFDPYRIWLLEGFKKQWQISPYLAPLLDALTSELSKANNVERSAKACTLYCTDLQLNGSRCLDQAQTSL